MADFNIKVPTSKEEMEALRKALNAELSDDILDGIVGGNDDGKSKESVDYVCPFCGELLHLKCEQDGYKHVVQDCPNNPYK